MEGNGTDLGVVNTVGNDNVRNVGRRRGRGIDLGTEHMGGTRSYRKGTPP